MCTSNDSTSNDSKIEDLKSNIDLKTVLPMKALTCLVNTTVMKLFNL